MLLRSRKVDAIDGLLPSHFPSPFLTFPHPRSKYLPWPSSGEIAMVRMWGVTLRLVAL